MASLTAAFLLVPWFMAGGHEQKDTKDCQVSVANLHRFEESRIQMGTTFRVVFYAADDKIAARAADAAFARIDELNSILSDYLDDSELTKLSLSAGRPPVKVSEDLFYILQRSNEISLLTDGAFDVTIGPTVRLWRRARRLRKLPDPDQIREYLRQTGYKRIKLDKGSRTVQLIGSPMRIDLGGIAKGYACDEALKQFAKLGITRALVDGGGGISVSDPPPGKPGWTTTIQPYGNEQGLELELAHQAVATSGDTSQFVEIDGKRYSHIVDPKTGIGLTNRLQVTVRANDGTTADALASALCVLGPEKGIALADSLPDVAVFMTQLDNQNRRRNFRSKNWTLNP